jgi:hypothetical protein
MTGMNRKDDMSKPTVVDRVVDRLDEKIAALVRVRRRLTDKEIPAWVLAGEHNGQDGHEDHQR